MQAAAELYQVAELHGRAAALFIKAGCTEQACLIMQDGQHEDLQLPLAQALEGVCMSAHFLPGL
jgi:hypothetical protein